MGLDAVFAETDARYRAQVISEIFGHLAPKPRDVYSGTIVFAQGEYHDLCIVKNTIDVDDSPWFYGDLYGDYFWQKKIGGRKIEVGRVYLWTGTYRKFKNGKGRFSGKVTRIT